MNLKLVGNRGIHIAWANLMGILLPFILGFGMVVMFPNMWGEYFKGETFYFAMFMGTALSISALPVIARTLMDLDLLNTDMGMIIIGTATINDLVGCCLLYTSFDFYSLPIDLHIFLNFLQRNQKC